MNISTKNVFLVVCGARVMHLVVQEVTLKTVGSLEGFFFFFFFNN
jgi:hypothetical protein